MRFRERTSTARHRSRFRAPLFVAVLLSSTQSGRALATDCQPTNGLSTCIDADNLRPHAGGGVFFAIGAPRTTPEGKSAFGLVASYLSRPIGLRVASPDPEGTVIFAVDNAVDTTFLWAFGVTDRLELTLALPVTVYQDGASVADVVGSDDALPRSVIRDGRFGLGYAIVPRPRVGSDTVLGLTAHLDFGAPFGAREAFASAGSIVVAPSIVTDVRVGRVLVGGEVGARLRPERSLASATIGSQIALALGASFDILSERRLTLSAEAFSLYTLASQKPPLRDHLKGEGGPPLIPTEWIASFSSASFLGGDVVFLAGGGGPIPLSSDAALTTPRFRFNFAVRYAPTGRDTDGDDVLDRDDACSTKAEDKDGFQDDDGCPELDNDGDRIPDTRDRCRDEAETVDGFQDDDGCPDDDDDKDFVADAVDKCRNVAEDPDNFEDEDGCPEPDNDRDGLPDPSDRCPNGAEDKDGWKDDDGCPDPDNDLDQVSDIVDRCRDVAEDRDGFNDGDGCPEPDNDEDGVADEADLCALPETINGDADNDGCPETNAQALVRWVGDRVVADKPARFRAGSADLTKAIQEEIRMLAQLIRGRAPIELILVETYADRPGDGSADAVVLADKRATAVKSVLVAAGLPAERITAATGDLAIRRPVNASQMEITATRARIEDKR